MRFIRATTWALSFLPSTAINIPVSLWDYQHGSADNRLLTLHVFIITRSKVNSFKETKLWGITRLGDKFESLLPAATKLWPRLCFYSCLWFCPRGGSAPGSRHPLVSHPLEQTPPRADTSPRRRHPPADPPDHAPPPPGPDTPRYMVNERPVRILLECILVW